MYSNLNSAVFLATLLFIVLGLEFVLGVRMDTPSFWVFAVPMAVLVFLNRLFAIRAMIEASAQQQVFAQRMHSAGLAEAERQRAALLDDLARGARENGEKNVQRFPNGGMVQ